MSNIFDKLTKDDLIELAMLNNGRLFSKLPVKFKKLHPDVKTPISATDGACGWDLYAYGNEELLFPQYMATPIKYHTGLSVEIPKGYVGLLLSRSSIYRTGKILANGVGVIDSDFRGEICFIFQPAQYHGDKTYKHDDRIGQLVIIPCPDVELVEVEELSETERGSGGFGSTGK